MQIIVYNQQRYSTYAERVRINVLFLQTYIDFEKKLAYINEKKFIRTTLQRMLTNITTYDNIILGDDIWETRFRK